MVTNFCCARAGAAKDAHANDMAAAIRVLRIVCLISLLLVLPLNRDRGIDRISQSLDDRVYPGVVDDKRRREEHVISARAVDRSAHRINQQSARHGFVLDPCMQLARWIKRLFGATIGHDLDPLKQTTAAQIADKRMIAEPLVETARKIAALTAHVF